MRAPHTISVRRELSQPCDHRVIASLQHRIRAPPRLLYQRVMSDGAVRLSRGVVQSRQQLVQLGTRDVEVRPVDSTAQTRAHDGNSLRGSPKLQQCAAELEIDARVAI